MLNRMSAQKDLKYLKQKLIALHPAPFHHYSESEFTQKTSQILNKNDLAESSKFPYYITTLLSTLRDSHTYVIPDNSYLGEENFPIRLRFFKGGYYITKASKDAKNILGKRLTSINGYSASDMEKKVSVLIPMENDASLKNYFPNHIIEPTAMKFLGEETQPIVYGVEDKSGKDIAKEIFPKDYHEDLLTATLPDITRSETAIRKEHYWGHAFKQHRTFYIQYNSCEEREDIKMKDLIKRIEWDNLKWIIVDLRNNKGGADEFLSPFILELKKHVESVTTVILISRTTFSSALTNASELADLPNSITVGVPTRSGPTHFGEVTEFQIPNSKLEISTSTELFTHPKYDIGESIIPDHTVETTIEDYMQGKDTHWEYLKKNIFT